jgi:WhiB family redox-sensing transcriptional regulator
MIQRPEVQPCLPLVAPFLPRAVRAELTAQIAARWAAKAACAASTVDPDSWFTDPSKPNHVAARAVCAGCPVRRSCLAYALAHDLQDGIWGGTDEAERDWLRLALVDGTPVAAVLGISTARVEVA